MTAFADLGLSQSALKAVERLEYTDPTPVQEQAIPIVLEGRDLIAAASTGTGKTAAFLLPILSNLPRGGRGKRAPRVLVVSPTRELAQQIAYTCIKIARATGHFATTVYGGSPYGPQIRELRGGTDVLIATPGRLNDLMDRGVVDLSQIETLVLDEADRMLDMGFLPDVTKIVEQTPAERQTLLFSATIDESIKKNLGTLLKDPAIVQVAKNGETAKTVEQFIMPIAQKDKQDLLEVVLREKGSERVIVFARTKNRTEECAEALCAAGFSAESIHSDKSQGRRKRALENFRRGKTDILVATDVLARGIDVSGVDHVINLDLPDMPEDYVHRIGRTGRAGEAGYAISFVSPNTRRTLREIEQLIDREIPMMELESYVLDPSILKKGKGGSSRKGSQASGHNGKPRREGQRSDRRNDSRGGHRSESKAGSKRVYESGRSGKPAGRRNDRNSDGRPAFENRETRRNKQFGSSRDERRSSSSRNDHRSNAGRNDQRTRNGKRTENTARSKKRTNTAGKSIMDVRSFGEKRNRARAREFGDE